MKGVRTSSGHVLSVQSRLLGSGLDGAHTTGATTLTVQDCSDFDDDLGGSLTLNGATYVYSNVDDDAGTLDISPALAANADDGDEATILDPILGSPQYTVTASVTEDGEDPGDPIEADVASDVVEQLPEGVRGLAGEAVTITWDEDDDPTVTGLAGLNNAQAGFVRGYQDFVTATGPGNLTIPLTHHPLPGSTIHVKWRGVDVPDAQWSLADDNWSLTIQDGNGLIQSGDECWAKYLYNDPATRPVIPATLTLIGSSHAVNGATSISMPAGALPGDILVLEMVSRTSSSPCSCADSRFGYSQAALGGVGLPSSSVYFGVGTADGSGTAVSITLPTGIGGASRAMLSVFRVTGTVSHTFTTLQTSAGGFSPTMPVGADMGIVMIVGENNTVAAPITADTSGNWTAVAYGTDSNNTLQSATHMAYSSSGMPSGLWAGLETSAAWAALTIGLTEA